MIRNTFAHIGNINFSDTDIAGIENEFKSVGQACATPKGIVNNKSLREHWVKGVLNSGNLFVADGFAWKGNICNPVNVRSITNEPELLKSLNSPKP